MSLKENLYTPVLGHLLPDLSPFLFPHLTFFEHPLTMDTAKINLFTPFDAYRAAYRNTYGTQNLLNADNSFDEIFGIEARAPVQG